MYGSYAQKNHYEKFRFIPKHDCILFEGSNIITRSQVAWVGTFKSSEADGQTNILFSKRHLKELFTAPSFFSTIKKH